jgi:chromosome segregation ATPase
VAPDAFGRDIYKRYCFENRKDAKMFTTYDRWQEGDIQAEEALAQLCQSLDSLEDRLEPLQQQKDTLRTQISEVVEHLGGRAELDWFGSLQITSPTITVSYDREALDALVARLTAEGQASIAQQIAACRKESPRAGSLRIKRLKG